MALKERQLIEITWDKPGTVVTGNLLRIEKIHYSDGVGIKYLLRDLVSGTLVSFKGATRLDVFLNHGDVGKLVEVTFVGLDGKEPKPGMSPAKVFRVAVDEETGPNPLDPSVFITDDDIPF